MINERPHKKLDVWKNSVDFCTDLYSVTKSFPDDEKYGLTSQMRRASVSIPSNIAEGLTRNTKLDKLRFLNIANSSASELDTQLEIALRLVYIDNDTFKDLEEKLIVVQKLLSGLIRSLR